MNLFNSIISNENIYKIKTLKAFCFFTFNNSITFLIRSQSTTKATTTTRPIKVMETSGTPRKTTKPEISTTDVVADVSTRNYMFLYIIKFTFCAL